MRDWRSLFIVLCLFSLLLPSVAFAEVKTIEAEGSYTMGDGLEESYAVAEQRARADALRKASHRAGIFVESISEVKDSTLTRDEVNIISSTVLEVKEEHLSKEVVAGQALRYRCHVVALVDTSAVMGQLRRSREDLAAAVARNKALEAETARMNAQIEDLKAQYAQAKDDVERASIRAKARLNEESFSAGEWIRKGNILSDRGASRQAIECYQKALELAPRSAMAYFCMGFAYGDLEDYDRAMNCYRQALSLGLDYSGVHAQMGGLYLRQQDYGLALQEYNRAIAEIKDNASLYALRGYCHELLHDYGEALDDYEEALRLNPGQKVAKDGMARIAWLME